MSKKINTTTKTPPQPVTMLEQRQRQKQEVEKEIINYLSNGIPKIEFLNWCFQVIFYLNKTEQKDAIDVLCSMAEALTGTGSERDRIINITQYDQEVFKNAIREVAGSFFDFWYAGTSDAYDIKDYNKFSKMLEVFMMLGELNHDYYWANLRIEYEEKKAA